MSAGARSLFSTTVSGAELQLTRSRLCESDPEREDERESEKKKGRENQSG